MRLVIAKLLLSMSYYYQLLLASTSNIDVIKCESCLLVKCLGRKIQNPIFEEYFTLISHEKGTRNNNYLLRLPRVKLEIAKQSFYYGGAKLYNTLPLDLRSVQTVVQFRKGLKGFF